MSNALLDRLKFTMIDDECQNNIRNIKEIIMEEAPIALDVLYNKIQEFPETRKFFSGAPQIDGAKARQLAHWNTVTSARLDQDYVQAVTRVGEVHARIGLEPRWYIGSYALVLDRLARKIVEARWPKKGFGVKNVSSKKAADEVGAIIKATLLDMELAISVYLDASESARKAVEAQVVQERAAVLASVRAAMAALSGGDLTYRMADDMPQEYERLRADFNAAMGKLEGVMATITANAQGILGGGEEIAKAADHLSRRTEQQAASLEETAAALDEITGTVRKTADGANDANAVVATAKTDAEHSGEVVKRAVDAMSAIETSSNQVSQIIGVIDEIAFQTNLLALNAGVEAARAGDAGRGFAVVASEVRSLAQRSAYAAKEIKGLIAASSQQVGAGVALVGETGQSLDRIVAHVNQINLLVTEIDSSAREQAAGLAEVNIAIEKMDQVTQQNAAMVEQSTAASHALCAAAADLAELVGQFKVGRSIPKSSVKTVRRLAHQPRTMMKSVGREGVAMKSALPAKDDWEDF